MLISNGDFIANQIQPGMKNQAVGKMVPVRPDMKTMQNGAAQLQNASEGDVFHGEVLNVTNNGEVRISLDDQSVLLARMAEAVNLNIGDSLDFLVKENDGSNIMIKPMLDSGQNAKDSTIFKVLDANGFMPTEKNYQIAESLMNHNMPVDKAGMQKIMQQAFKYPDASIEQLVNMNKAGLPVNETTIKQYIDYQNNTHQLSENIHQLTDSIVDFAADTVLDMAASSEGQPSELFAFVDKLFATLSDDGEIQAFSNEQNAMQDNPDMGNVLLDQNVSDMKTADGNMTLQGELNPLISESATETVSDDINASDFAGTFADKLGISRELADKFLSELSSFSLDENKTKELLDTSRDALEFLQKLNETIKDQSDRKELDSSLVAKLFRSEGYKEMFSAALQKKFSLEPENMKNPKELNDLYKKIYEKTEKLLSNFEMGGGASSDSMREQAKSTQQRIDFIQNLNELYGYTQIPVHISGEQLNSDLFVYMNQKGKFQKKEETSALLHLDMEHLGATDVHVSLSNNTVHTRFYVEDELSAKIIDEHMQRLEKALMQAGFSHTNEVVTRTNSNTSKQSNMVVDTMLNQEMEKSVKRYSFDIRT